MMSMSGKLCQPPPNLCFAFHTLYRHCSQLSCRPRRLSGLHATLSVSLPATDASSSHRLLQQVHPAAILVDTKPLYT